MKLESVRDPVFWEYGQIVEGYDFSGMLKILKEKTPRPLDNVLYVASEPLLEKLPVFRELEAGFYGGMPIQAGYCNGHNILLNALEYHRNSEINVTVDDMILLLAKRSDRDPRDLNIDSGKVRVFFVPAGTAIELYATTLHYAPSSADETGYQVAVILPRGTNGPKPAVTVKTTEDRLLSCVNNWLMAHSQAKGEISRGTYVGIRGKNIDVRTFWK